MADNIKLEDPSTWPKKFRYLFYFLIVSIGIILIIGLFTIFFKTIDDIILVISQSAVFGALVITYSLGARTIKGTFLDVFKKLFTNFNFDEFTISTLTTWVYYFANYIFWFYSLNNLRILLDYPELYLTQLLLSIFLLLVTRVFLELTIAVIKIAENTMPEKKPLITRGD